MSLKDTNEMDTLNTLAGILIILAYFASVCGVAYLMRVSADIRKARRMASACADMRRGMRELSYREEYNGGITQYGWNSGRPVATITNTYGDTETYTVKTSGRTRRYTNGKDAYEGMLEMLVMDERDNTLNICSLMKGSE